MLDEPGEDDAGEEGLAGAGGAEDAGAALDELLEVDAHGVILLAGAADDEIGTAGFTEDLGHITRGGQAGEGMVRRHGLDGQRTRTVLVLVGFGPLHVIW